MWGHVTGDLEAGLGLTEKLTTVMREATSGGVAGGATPLMTSVILPGIALANLLLAGKIFAGSDKDAATNGAVILGGYGVIGYLAAKAGVFAGTWMGWLPLVNFALAAYCVKELL